MSLSAFKPSLRRLSPFRLSYVACRNFNPTWSEKVISREIQKDGKIQLFIDFSVSNAIVAFVFVLSRK